jgi:hypothetical protein
VWLKHANGTEGREAIKNASTHVGLNVSHEETGLGVSDVKSHGADSPNLMMLSNTLFERQARTRFTQPDFRARINTSLADRSEGHTMGGEDLTSFDAPPLQCGTKTVALADTSEVLRKFDQDTRLMTRVMLSLVLGAATVLGCEELVQTKSLSLGLVRTVGATDEAQATRITSSAPPEIAYRSVESPASNSSSFRALSSQSNPIDGQITASQRSAEPAEGLPEPKSKSLRHRPSMHHKVADVRTRLLMLWHASLSRSGQSARSWNVFWRSNDH